MSWRSFLYRESRWIRHNWGTLLLLFLVVPSLFAASTTAFGQVIPRDTPVAVVPAEESVTEDELGAVRGVAAFFSRPHEYDSREAATRALHREEVYATIVVPHGLYDEDETVSIEMVVEAEMVPYEQPSLAIANLLQGRIDDPFPASVSVTRTTVGEDRTLSGFLLSAGTVLISMAYALVYLPHVVRGERPVFRRVRATSSLGRLLAVKIGLFAALLVGTLVALQACATYLGFEVALLAPGAVLAVLLTFLSLGAIALGVEFLLSFRTSGRMLDVALLFGILLTGSLVYPAGFFSPLRRTLARVNPIHHAMTVQRGISLKGLSPELFVDRYALLVVFLACSTGFLAASVLWYQRRH